MNYLQYNKWIVWMVCGAIIAIAGMLAAYAQISFGAPAIRDENNIPAVFGSSCESATATQVAISNSASTLIQATTTRRALVRVEQPLNATNTVSVALNGAAAVSGSGIVLSPATTTNAAPMNKAELGLATIFPYTGSIAAITSSGGAVVTVTTCTY